MKLLVFSRLLNPSSKKKTFEDKEMYFENTDFSLDDLYRSLNFINKHKEALQLWIHKHIKEQYNRNTDLVYYDVTNYYFEIDEPDDLRKKGVCKEHRPNPIVQMGLFMDNIGMPIAYKLFSGNTVDKVTLIPMLRQVKKEYDLGRIIVVADKGLNTGDNIYYTLSRKDGYVISQTVRGANEELKSYVLNEDGYTWYGKEYKKKSRLCPREISVTSVSGKKIKRTVHEKQVIFYSEDYAKRAKADRAPALMKAMDLISNPGKYNKAISYGAAKYVKNIEFDKKTGEILTTKSLPLLDEDKLRKEEEMDGYYAIITSEWEKTDDEIIEIYRGLWRIEESFKVTKSELEARPVYLSRDAHIEAHFLTCFIALAIARILQHRTNDKHSVGKILESLSKVSCSHVQENYYLFDYCDEITAAIGDAFSIDFKKKYLKLSEIKKILGETKKN
jgi:transposase